MEKYENQFQSPTLEVYSALGYIDCDWSNSVLVRHADPYENHLAYNDGDELHKLYLLEGDWERLCKADFPWQYIPDLSQTTDQDVIRIEIGDGFYEVRPHNSCLCLFGDPSYNHIEHQSDPQHLRGIKADPELYRDMFEYEYPVRYLPYIDRATFEWHGTLE